MRKMQDPSPDGSLVITVPIQMKRVAGRKLVVLAEGSDDPDMNRYGDRPSTPRPRAAERGEMRIARSNVQDSPAHRALRDHAIRTALAIRWVRLLEDGTFDSMASLARAVGVDPSGMARRVRRADGKRGWV